MAAGRQKRNRTAITRVRMVAKADGTGFVTVKRVPTLVPLLPRAAVEASATQLRVLAEESRELLLDRIFAAQPQAPGKKVVDRPTRTRLPKLKAAPRRPFPHAPLSKRHRQHKAREGQDGRILVATGDYVEGIEVFRGEQVRGGVYYMVRPAARTHEPSGLRLTTIARILELGSARHKIPARPHWSPTVRDVIRRFEQEAPNIRAKALREALRKMR